MAGALAAVTAWVGRASASRCGPGWRSPVVGRVRASAPAGDLCDPGLPRDAGGVGGDGRHRCARRAPRRAEGKCGSGRRGGGRGRAAVAVAEVRARRRHPRRRVLLDPAPPAGSSPWRPQWRRPAASPSPWSCTTGSTAAGPRSPPRGSPPPNGRRGGRPRCEPPTCVGRSRRLTGLLVDDTFGLAAWSPAWLFLPLAAGAAVRSLRGPGRARSRRRWSVLLPSWPWVAGGGVRGADDAWLVVARAASSWWCSRSASSLLARLLEERPSAAAAVLRRRRARRRHLVLDHGRGGDPAPHAGRRLRRRAQPLVPAVAGGPAGRALGCAPIVRTSCGWLVALGAWPLAERCAPSPRAAGAGRSVDVAGPWRTGPRRLRKVCLQSVNFDSGYGEVGR